MTTMYKETLAQEEAAIYRASAVTSKFKQQIAYGMGAATVFGLVSAIAKTLFDVAGAALVAPTAGAGAVAGAAAVWPIVGLVALGFAGVGLLYLSAKYLSENTVLDQQLQAKQICAATHANAPVIEQAVAKAQEFPSVDASKADMGPTSSIGDERALMDTVAARDTQTMRAA